MKTSLPTLLSSLLVVFGLSSCIPMDPYYDGGGYQSGGGYGGGSYGGGGYGGGSSYGNSYGGGYSQRPSYSRPYGSNYGYSSGHDHHDHHDYDDDRRRSSSSSNKKDKNDTLYRYRGKNGPDGNHTIDWWHSRGYQRSQLDFAD